MADAIPNGSAKRYDENESPALESQRPDDSATIEDHSAEISFRLEIVRVPGREGAMLQAIQARAVRQALLWAAEQELHGDAGEEEHDDRRTR